MNEPLDIDERESGRFALTFKDLPVGARFRQVNHQPRREWVKVTPIEATATSARHNAISADGQRATQVGHATLVAIPPYDDQPTPRQARHARAQQMRRSRQEQAALRLGFATIDHLVNAVLSMSDEKAAEVRHVLLS